jgi:hypothetical protein
MVEAEWKAVLNTLIENDIRDAFKKWQKRWEWCRGTEGTTLRVTVTVSSRPKVNC